MDLRKVFDQTVRDLKREVNKKVLKVPEIEQKVLDATSNEPWGPHGTVMSEIAQATRNFNDYQMIMSLLWKRLSDTGKNWRHVYKGLTVFDFLVAHGADRVIDELREHVFQIQGLLDFQYVEPNGKDQGINVRKKAQALVSLLNDKDKIREVREKAASNRDKYQGYSSTGGFKPSSYSSAGRGFSDWNDDRNGYGDKYGSKYDDDRYAKGGERENDRYRDDYDYDKQSKGFESDDNDYTTRTKTAPPSYEESRKKDVKPKSQSLNIPTVNEDDDFDPRAPVSAPRTTVKPATNAQADFLGDIDFFSTPSIADPFSDSTSNSKKSEPVTSSTDLFAAAPTSDPFGSNDFGAFASASSTNTFDAFDSKPSSKNNAASNTLFDPFADTLHASNNAFDAFGNTASNNAFESDPNSSNVFDNNITASFNAFDDQALDNKGTSFDAFGDVLSGNTSNIPAAASDMPGAQSKQSFQTKSSVWADSLTSGLIDLNISAPKSNSLADLGIQLDSGFGSEWPKEEKSQGGLKGKAMGTGSGLGLAGASGLAPRPPPPTMASDFGLGAYTGAYSQASTASYSQPSVAYFQAPAQPDPFASLASFR